MNKLTLSLLLFLFSIGVSAQTQMISVKEFEKQPFITKDRDNEQFLKEFYLQKESMFLPQKPKPQIKGVDRSEPDTIYCYRLWGSNERHIFSYKNGRCITLLKQYEESGQPRC